VDLRYSPSTPTSTTPSGNGYWLVASDGGVFAFGDARFLGSTGALRLARPIVGMAPTPSGNGYWLAASDGGVFAFGDARFLGSTGASDVASILAEPSGLGYRLLATSGTIQRFGLPEAATPPQARVPQRQFSVDLGPPEPVQLSGFGLTHYPDTHLPFLRVPNGVEVFISAGVSSYLFVGPSFGALRPHAVAGSTGAAAPVLGPDGSSWANAYAALATVIPWPAAGPAGRLGLFHAETCPERSRFTASIGAAISRDGGQTWTDRTQVLRGLTPSPPCSRVQGVGQPSAIVAGDHLYVFHTAWRATGADEVALARVRFDRAMDPGAWETWAGSGGWVTAASGESAPVIRRPEPGSASVYAANVSVSFNRILGRYLAVFETKGGFAYTTSEDLTSWEPGTTFLPVPAAAALRPSYPTLLDETADNDRETSALNRLYYAENVGPGSNHQLYRRSFVVRTT
ncbi:MAG: DUF4185 domain-containing protein, partial [Acidimicrobiales bacterium]